MRRGPPPPWLVVIASSSGGMEALLALVAALPADLPAAVLIVSHTPVTSSRGLPRLLSAVGPLPAFYPDEGQVLEAGRIYVAPPDRHLVVQRGRIHLSSGEKEHSLRPAADVLFRSAARTYGRRGLGIVLSGGGRDGAAGLAELQATGGLALIQAPDDAKCAAMPLSALSVVRPDACLPAAELGRAVVRLVHERLPPARAPRRERRARRRPLSLKGLRILLAEDEYLIAAEIVGMLRGLGCSAVGPVADVGAGLRMLEQEGPWLDCALLDMDLRGELALPLASALTRRAVPFVFATGYGETTLSGAWAGAPRLQKPYDAQALGAALRRALRLRWFPPPEAPTALVGIDRHVEVLKDSRDLLMRARALRAFSSDRLLTQSTEAVRRSRECIAHSALLEQTTRRVPRGGPRSGTDAGDDPGEDGE